MEYMVASKNPLAHKIAFLLIALFSTACLRLCAESVAMSPEQAKEARVRFMEQAEKLTGCPYVYGAVGPDRFDCSGFVYYVAREALKIQLPRTARAIYSYTDPVSAENMEPGDLVFFKTTSSGNISHVGIYLGERKFISALSDGSKTGVVISSLDSSYWKPRFCGAGQILPSGKMKEHLEAFEDSEEYDVEGLLDTIRMIDRDTFIEETVIEKEPLVGKIETVSPLLLSCKSVVNRIKLLFENRV